MAIKKYKKFSVTVGNDGAIIVKKGDWLSKYSAAFNRGDTTKLNEYGIKEKGVVEPIPSRDLKEGETIYHIPTYERWLDANPKEKAKAHAYKAIKDFEKRKSGPRAFKTIPRLLVVDGLRERIENPGKINQFQAGVCPSAALLFSVARDFPAIYANFVIDLYEKGSGNIKGWNIRPSTDLKNYQLLFMPLDHRVVSWRGKIMVPAVDWIPLASIRDSENIFFDYQKIGGKGVWSGGAFPDEIERWFKKAGYMEIVSENFEKELWSMTDKKTRWNIKLASDYRGLGYKVILLVDANVLSLDWRTRENKGRANHVIALTSKVNFQRVGGGENISMEVFTWGKRKHRIPLVGAMSTQDFLGFYYGFVAAKY